MWCVSVLLNHKISCPLLSAHEFGSDLASVEYERDGVESESENGARE